LPTSQTATGPEGVNVRFSQPEAHAALGEQPQDPPSESADPIGDADTVVANAQPLCHNGHANGCPAEFPAH